MSAKNSEMGSVFSDVLEAIRGMQDAGMPGDVIERMVERLLRAKLKSMAQEEFRFSVEPSGECRGMAL